jgi:putative transposase
MPDHCHILIGLNPAASISDTVRDVKVASTKWINEERLSPYKFGWQQGFGAFSYSKARLIVFVNTS